ncbi:class I SAM-dependent methyltransferase [Phenylobacterium sp.]|uniref:class I SAM-dependent methyltransferase n=1 Tax=Phenylobacterium sp. TaxID=1871053 RepID=UPI00301C66DF
MGSGTTAPQQAGDADYGAISDAYVDYRRPDPRIAAAIERALGDARTVVNVGAGTGSYEPVGRTVTPVEPSANMRAERPGHLQPAVDAVAEDLPFADGAFDAAMTTFSVHQWPDLEKGLAEVRRVTRGPIVILTCDPVLVEGFWLAEYAPEVLAVEARRYPGLDRIAAALGGQVSVDTVPIPLDCLDGFQEAYYGRPEMFLDADARRACSAWSFVDDGVVVRLEERLAEDLRSGEWDRKHGHLRAAPLFDGSLRLIVGR